MDSMNRIYGLIKRGLVVPFTIPAYDFDITKGRQMSLKSFAVFVPVFAFAMGFLHSTGILHNTMKPELGFIYGIMFALLTPYVMTRELCKKNNRTFALALPADIWEKFCALLAICFVIIPLYCALSSGICYYAGVVLYGGIFKGTFLTEFDWQFLRELFSPIVISLAVMYISSALLLSLLIKNEMVQAVVVILQFVVMFAFGGFVLMFAEDLQLQWLGDKWASLGLYPLISIACLVGSYLKIKKERA